MNKKGFTIVEVVIAFSILAVLVLALIEFTVNYRGKVRDEELRTELIDYKNTITKIIYDDIILGGINRMEKCPNEEDNNITCVNFFDKNNVAHPLLLVTVNSNSNSLKKGLYLNYDGNYYMLPDSEPSSNGEKACEFITAFVLKKYQSVYNMKISYKHANFNDTYDISITVN